MQPVCAYAVCEYFFDVNEPPKPNAAVPLKQDIVFCQKSMKRLSGTEWFNSRL